MAQGSYIWRNVSGQSTEECAPNCLGIDYSYHPDLDYIKCVNHFQNNANIKRLSLKRRPKVAINNAEKSSSASSSQWYSAESLSSYSSDDTRLLGMSSTTSRRPPLPPPHGSSLDNKSSRGEGPTTSQVESKPQPAARSFPSQKQSPVVGDTIMETLEQEVKTQLPPQPQPRRRLASFGGVSSHGSLSPFTGLGAYNLNINGNKPTSTGDDMHVHLSSSLGSRGSTGCLRQSPQSSGRTTPAIGLGPMHLQHVRDQMVVALQRLKELEEQVTIIPILQVNISVLQEEKRQLVSQLKNQVTTRTSIV
ncbi:KN motif and ankyrin repeat domain containing protein 1 [Dissostichus eleginoides]|uniref:KN motif and ankyrin repeat domain containing protein 1 n=1 Tax=Dissostichus eleginoides TaxID=100907 RepID=A0AAD9BJ49_DISEL|nr:KN motif and ankyrin repeat domain containing protein 1 [Dissostichus eleginoides]